MQYKENSVNYLFKGLYTNYVTFFLEFLNPSPFKFFHIFKAHFFKIESIYKQPHFYKHQQPRLNQTFQNIIDMQLKNATTQSSS